VVERFLANLAGGGHVRKSNDRSLTSSKKPRIVGSSNGDGWLSVSDTGDREAQARYLHRPFAQAMHKVPSPTTFNRNYLGRFPVLDKSGHR
jgi:hypothetical protein